MWKVTGEYGTIREEKLPVFRPELFCKLDISKRGKDMEKTAWWKKSVVYEIYVRSFQDSDGDGIGDIRGIIQRLDYLRELGVDVLWLTPVYDSPGEDNGYDISDYCSIMSTFGTMADFEELLQKAHQKGIRIVMDLVVNHTSDRHPWFLESRRSKDNPYRDYYIWRDGKENQPPNNWTSCFLGSAWKYEPETEQYYLHMFADQQPDLNWDYEPVRREVFRMMKWWLDKGIDGFRMDVISLISKDAQALCTDSDIKGHTVCANGPRVHEYLQEMRREVLSHYDIMTVGETPAVTVEEAHRYASLDSRELDMVFQFELMDVDGGESGKWNDTRFQLQDVKKVLRKWQKGLHNQAWNSLFWNNHDQPRVVSRFGNTSTAEYWNKSAKMLATALYFLQGTPYIYQGEELGMTNVEFTEIGQFRDIESLRAYDQYVNQEKSISEEDMLRFLRKSSRDNGRTPMQWSKEPGAGFSTGEPWIEVNANYSWLNAEAQMADEDSVFHYYRRMIGILKENPIVCDGDFQEYCPDSEAVYAYCRSAAQGKVYVFCNFTDQVQETEEDMIPEGAQTTVLLGNYKTHEKGRLQAYEAIVYQVTELL